MGVNVCCNQIKKRKEKRDVHSTNINDSIEKEYNIEDLEKKLLNFIYEPIKYDKFYDAKDADEIFNLQKQYEKDELNKYFEINNNIIKDQINNAINSLENDYSYNNDNIINKLVLDLIGLENGKNKLIERFKKNHLKKNNKNNTIGNFNQIKIIVCGKPSTGKTTLINCLYNPNNISNSYFKFEEIILFNNFPINIDNEKFKIINYINEQKKTNNINNYVNCIWYCFNNGTLYNEEISLINSINNLYNKTIPIILIHTMSINMEHINSISYIKINNVEILKILAMNYFCQNNGMIQSFGLDILINKTLELWKKSSSLNNKNLDEYIKQIKSDNNSISKNVFEQIANNFINEYNSMKSNEEFIQYLIEIFRMNIQYFFSDVIFQESKYRIYNENYLIRPMREYINYYEKNSKILFDPIINSYAIKFFNHQRNIQIEKNCNINPMNFRNKNKILIDLTKYLNDNYIYIFQKNYIYYIFYKKFGFFCEYFRKELNNLSEQITFIPDNNDLQCQQFINNVKNSFGLNNNMNNKLNNPKNENNDLNSSMMSQTIINNNNIFNNNYLNNNNMSNFNNNNNMVNFNNNCINNNNMINMNFKNNMNNINHNMNFENGSNNMNNFCGDINDFNNNDMNNFNNNIININLNYIQNNINKETTLFLPSETEIYNSKKANQGLNQNINNPDIK